MCQIPARIVAGGDTAPRLAGYLTCYASAVAGHEAIRRKHVLLLAIASASILAIGSLLRPREHRPAPSAAATESELARLATLSERRSIETMIDDFGRVAANVGPSMVWLPTEHATALAWNDHTILAPQLDRRAADPVDVATRLARSGAFVRLRGPHLPFAALESPTTLGVLPVSRARAPVAAGTWIIGVWRTGASQPAFAPGNLAGTTPVTCEHLALREWTTTLALTPAMIGGGLFDIDGGLLALVLPCEGRLAAIGAASLDPYVARPPAAADRIAARYGFRAGPLTDAEVDYFKTRDGLIVRDVWVGYPAEVAGLRPGDIIQSTGVNEPATPEALQALGAEAPAPERTFSVVRGASRVAILLPAADEAADAVPAGGTGSGFVMAPPRSGLRIDSVSPESPAWAAGIRPGDWLLRIGDAVPRALDDARGLLDGSATPAFIVLERDGHRWGLLLL